MVNETNTQDLSALTEFINDMYNGDPSPLTHRLDEAVYMLHYLRPGHFTDKEIQEVAFVLRKLRGCLR